MSRPRLTIAASIVVLPIITAGCGGRLPERVDSLEQARASITQVASSPLAGRAAGEELAAARDALASADEAFEEGEDLELIEHRAYIAQRYADISRERVSEAEAREEVDRGEAERNRIIAEARAREAEAAQLAAAAAARELEVQNRAAEENARAAQAAQERARQLEQELAALQVQAEESAERGLVLTLGDVLFDTGQAQLQTGAMATLDRLSQFMRDYPERSIRIEGHTDSAGSDAANQTLSEMRAFAVRDALLARGIDASRIATVGYGESRPVASNNTDGGRQQNRRIEIVVSDDEGAFRDTGGR
jgi:outer membrane protein OmpA-like peptidoglycan-associated protein